MVERNSVHATSVGAPRRRVAAVASIAAVVWLVAWSAASDRFGPTWDAANVEYPLGERALAYVLRRPVAGAESDRPGSYSEHMAAETRPGPRATPEPKFHKPIGVDTTWPLSPILAAASYEVLSVRLGRLDAFPALHLPTAFAAALAVFLVATFAGRRLGLVAACVAPAFLLTSPRFCAHAMNNMKDVPETALYFAAVWAWAAALRRGGSSRHALAGALTGAALAQKANALFLGPHVLLLFVLLRCFAGRAGERARVDFARTGLAAVAFVGAYVALSPQFWDDPAERFAAHFGHVFSTGNALIAGDATRKGTSFDAATVALVSTPPALLLFALVGSLAPGLGRADRGFLVLGAVFPVARMLIPGMTNYDGVRHFMEFYPPLCILAAAGVAATTRLVIRVAKGATFRVVVAVIVPVACLTPSGVALAKVMPDGTVYYSDLFGGVPAARARGDVDATDYWANAYWRAFDWFNEHAEEGACLVAPVAPNVAICAAPVRARPDLSVEPGRDHADYLAGRRVVYVFYITRESWYPGVLRTEDALRTPVHTIDVDGVPVLKILRYDRGVDAAKAAEGALLLRAGMRGKLRLIEWAAGKKDRVRSCLDILVDRSIDRGAALRALIGRPDDRDVDAFVHFVFD